MTEYPNPIGQERENAYRIDGLVARVDGLEKENKASSDLLIRIDERLKILVEDIKTFKDGFVTKNEFLPIQKLVYGAVGLALTALGGTVLSLAMR